MLGLIEGKVDVYVLLPEDGGPVRSATAKKAMQDVVCASLMGLQPSCALSWSGSEESLTTVGKKAEGTVGEGMLLRTLSARWKGNE